ncbi:hypothetical protein [Fusobacterium ulcerans]|uniref:hypothetical protein n=1 Tax=Fusobacterium ulcerans TaxID=861 RepID=UPI0020670300|nr:hypothetical protein [Fusobacterium ulcerans]MEE0139031.1 hypothetical protein [Fusobacterium ulcerans]DAE81036.1 MAG TPA: tail protein [Caudoviricetes sp.]
MNVYFDRVSKLKIGQFEIDDSLEVEWNYEVRIDEPAAILTVRIYNLSDDVIKGILKDDEVSFDFGYENQTFPFFKGILQGANTGKNGVDRITDITCVEYTSNVFKKVSRSYKKDTTSDYIIKDLCEVCGFTLKRLDLENVIKYTTGYNIYDIPLISLKKIINSCNSHYSIRGNDLVVTKDKTGNNIGVEFNFDSGLLDYPQEILSIERPKEQEKKAIEKKDKKVQATHLIRAIANPEVKKLDIIKALGKEYQVLSIRIGDWTAIMEVLFLG